MVYLYALLLIVFFLLLWVIPRGEIAYNTNNIDHIIGLTPTGKIRGSVVIAGTARDLGKYAIPSIEKMINMGLYFDKYHIIIAEGNSKDDTLNILSTFSSKYPNLITVESKYDESESRTVRISNARNRILSLIKELDYVPDYYILMDMDDKSIADPSSILTCFSENTPKDWYMMGGNNRGDYYDLWALRTIDDWQPEDPHRERVYNKNYRFKHKAVDRFTEVVSCFNGIAIYKYKFVLGSKYTGKYDPDITDRDMCEHVPFNEEVKINSGELKSYINPLLIVESKPVLSILRESLCNRISNIRLLLKESMTT